LWESLDSMGRHAERSVGRGDEGLRREGVQRARLFSVKCVEPDAPGDPSAPAVKGGYLPRPDLVGQVRQQQAIPFGGVAPSETPQHGAAPPPHLAIELDGAAIHTKRLVCSQGFTGAPGKEHLGHLPVRELGNCRLPARLPADDVPHPVRVAGAEASHAGRRLVHQQAVTSPELIDLTMAAVMFAGRMEIG
jgi:hypothetical protein